MACRNSWQAGAKERGGSMFGLFRKGTLLDAELTAWQFGCFEWLLQHTGGMEAFRQRRLILPTPQFFPHDGSRGHAFAEMIFQQVKMHAGMADWPCDLQCQQDDPDPKVSRYAYVKGAPSSPAGTFRTRNDGTALITYHPDELSDPMALVATFAHELAHYRTAVFPEPPPGGWEVWEPATDLAAAFLGFGIFMANSRFRFSHFSDGKTSGWQWRQRGYISDAEVLHAHAIFSHLLNVGRDETVPHLKSALRGIYKRLHKDVAGAADSLQRLRQVITSDLPA
jgi:hypothetical protein